MASMPVVLHRYRIPTYPAQSPDTSRNAAANKGVIHQARLFFHPPNRRRDPNHRSVRLPALRPKRSAARAREEKTNRTRDHTTETTTRQTHKHKGERTHTQCRARGFVQRTMAVPPGAPRAATNTKLHGHMHTHVSKSTHPAARTSIIAVFCSAGASLKHGTSAHDERACDTSTPARRLRRSRRTPRQWTCPLLMCSTPPRCRRGLSPPPTRA